MLCTNVMPCNNATCNAVLTSTMNLSSAVGPSYTTIVPGCAAGNVALITHAVVHSGRISQLRKYGIARCAPPREIHRKTRLSQTHFPSAPRGSGVTCLHACCAAMIRTLPRFAKSTVRAVHVVSDAGGAGGGSAGAVVHSPHVRAHCSRVWSVAGAWHTPLDCSARQSLR